MYLLLRDYKGKKIREDVKPDSVGWQVIANEQSFI